jgi:hypothetical protein
MAGPTRATTRWDGEAGAYPSYDSAGAYGFIPELWSGILVENLYPSSVFSDISNTNYEGEIKAKGDVVNIRTKPHMAISDYEVGGGLTYEVPGSNKVQLAVNNAKSFSFQVNDVDEAQSDIEQMVSMFQEGAEEDLKAAIDADCLSKISADVAAANKGATAGAESGNIDLGTTGSAISLTETNIIQKIVEMGQVLDEQHLPQTGRWLVLPPWACTRVLLSELKDASIAGDGTSIARNGRMGQIGRFTIYQSTQLPTVSDTGTKWKIFGGHRNFLTWATQMLNMEALPNPSDFGQLVRGLAVYGAKVTKGEGIVELYAAPGALGA